MQQKMKKNKQNDQFFSSKSSRSVITRGSKNKPIQQEEQKQEFPYFRNNPVRQKIMNQVHTIADVNSQSNLHLDKASTIVSDLMVRHQKAKERLQKMKQESEKNYQRIYPFAPNCQSNSDRYIVKGDVIRRNQIWLREKKRKNLELKEQTVMEQIKECTFSPNIRSKKQSEIYLRNRSRSRSVTPKSKYVSKKSQQVHGQENSFTRGGRKDYTQAQYQSAKQNLISRMMNIAY